MAQFRKKPVVIEAFILGVDCIPDWFMDRVSANEVILHLDKINPHEGGAIIKTLEGNMNASYGEWIIKGVKGEIYPCKPDIFAETYEPA